jgi:hypothetical protein
MEVLAGMRKVLGDEKCNKCYLLEPSLAATTDLY